MLIDTHAHLASNRFLDDLPEVIARSVEAGVTHIVSIASDLEDSRRNLEIAEQFDEVSATVGIHPTSIHEIDCDNWLEKIRKYTQQPGVVAIGEIGLDYFHPPADGSTPEEWRQRQEVFFRSQLDLAVELQLPVVIHQRDRDNSNDCRNDLLRVMGDYENRIQAVFHCFTGTLEEAQTYLDMGHLISFTGIATFPSAEELQETARQVPADTFMLETDSPYLAPVPHRGKRCEPAYTRHTAEHIASLRGISCEEIAAFTTENAIRFFGLSPD